MSWQVSDLESSRKLKELGVVQESLFWWVNIPDGIPSDHKYQTGWRLTSGASTIKMEKCSAFTCAELGVALPYAYYSFKLHEKSTWSCIPKEMDLLISEGNTEAQARSLMLIYLLEQKLITVEEVNARLLGVGK